MTYTCECLDCGHVLETEQHCREIKCPECGGEMRRIERPGPGQKDGRAESREEQTAHRAGAKGRLITELAARPWAMNLAHLRLLAERARTYESPLDAETLLALQEPRPDAAAGYAVAEGVAVIPIVGTIFKEMPWIYAVSDCDATSTLEVEAQLAAALEDPGVKAILLYVDSPGGVIDGVQELADAIYQARGQKPIHAFISDMGASAAYWIASQADTVTANQTAAVGSIGVYMVLDDISKMYLDAGVRTIVLKSGPDKGTGVEGAPITDQQLEPLLDEVLGLAAMFRAAVQRGRGLSAAAVQAAATGRCWLAPEAETFGLIDKVQNKEQALEAATPRRTGMFATTLKTKEQVMALWPFKKKVEAEVSEQPASSPDDEETQVIESELVADEPAPEPEAPAEGQPEPEEAEEASLEIEAESTADEGVATVVLTQDALGIVKHYSDAVGNEAALEAITAGMSLHDAMAQRIASLSDEIEQKNGEIERLNQRIAAAQLDGEETPASATEDQGPPSKHQQNLGPNLGKVAESMRLPGRE